MKTNNNTITELVFILDRSGSMSGLESDTIGGFNSMIEKQRKEDGECYVSTILFNNESKVLHDRITSIISEAKKSDSVTAIEIPLLFEAHYEKEVDKVLTVYAPADARKKFLAKRGFDFDEMQKRDLQQMPLEEKVKLADYVIVNSADENFLKEQFFSLI